MTIRNSTNLSIAMATWLASDFYDHSPDPDEISVTTLLKPLRELILLLQNPQIEADTDATNYISSSIGTAIHMNVEMAWLKCRKSAMKNLGYPEKLIDRMRLDPTEEDLKADPTIIPVYMERRSKRKLGPFTISGKFDFVIQGSLTDFKSSMIYSWQKGSSTPKYVKQGSIYRWLNPDIITEDILNLDYVFLDWSAGKSTYEKNYPPQRIMTEKHTMMSLEETEAWLTQRVNDVIRLRNAPQDQLPLCTPFELWQDKPVFKYYKNPNSKSRSTKNFTTYGEAQQRHHADGGVGEIVQVNPKAKACLYCSALNVCEQAQNMVVNGTLDT